MRKHHKRPTPLILTLNAASWTAEYVAANPSRRAGLEKWRKDEIRDALRSETDNLCVYCESYVEAVAATQVEHMLPKKSFPSLVYDWANLTLACPRCNQHKGQYYDAQQPLIHPYNDDPQEHIEFLGAFVTAKGGSPMGWRTIERLKLRRPGLNRSRERTLIALEQQHLRMRMLSGSDARLAAALMQKAGEPTAEFHSMSRAVLAAWQVSRAATRKRT